MSWKLKSRLHIAVVLMAPAWCAFGQSVEIDFAAKKVIQGGSLVVDKKLQAKVVVTHVNDILYDYTIKAVATPKQIDDFSTLAGLIAPAAAAAPLDQAGCALALAPLVQAGTNITNLLRSPMFKDDAETQPIDK